MIIRSLIYDSSKSHSLLSNANQNNRPYPDTHRNKKSGFNLSLCFYGLLSMCDLTSFPEKSYKHPPRTLLNAPVLNDWITSILRWGLAAMMIAGYMLSAWIPTTNVERTGGLLKRENIRQ